MIVFTKQFAGSEPPADIEADREAFAFNSRPLGFDRLPVPLADADSFAFGFIVAGGHQHLAFFMAIVAGDADFAFHVLPAARAHADALTDTDAAAMLIA